MKHIVVVGGGIGGLRAVQALRGEGFEGRITLVGAELELPYDRPPLSKDVLTGARSPESTRLAPAELLDDLDVTVRLGQAAEGFDLADHSLRTAEGVLRFDGVILAPGASPRTLPVCAGVAGVYMLRTLADALAIRDRLALSRHVVIVGAGFIGSEVAASAHARNVEVTLVDLEPAPLARAVGGTMGEVLTALHTDNGATLRMGVSVTAVEGNGSKRLWLSDGTTIECDFVVVGIGAAPNVDWLEGSGLLLNDGIVCDAALNAGAPSVYAIGDAASWPNELLGRRMRIEHWTNAAEQARHAARNLLGGTALPYRGSNYVWSDQYGMRVQCVGDTSSGEPVVIDGDLGERRFVAWYRSGEQLVGALGMNSAKLLMRSKLLIEERTSWDDSLSELERSE